MLKNIPTWVLLVGGSFALSYAAQQAGQGVNTAGTGILKAGGGLALGAWAWRLLAVAAV